MGIIVNSGDSGEPSTSAAPSTPASSSSSGSNDSVVVTIPPGANAAQTIATALGTQSPLVAEGATPQSAGSVTSPAPPTNTVKVADLTGSSSDFQPPVNVPGYANALQSADMRVRLAALNPSDIFGLDTTTTSILYPLQNIGGNVGGGILFPYTPSIAYSQSVAYMDLNLVHSDTDYAAYTRTSSVTISITGKFTVQSQREGLYALACLHFLRIASKSYFGEADKTAGKAGLPPPILVLDGYGNYMLNQLRVILKSHSWTFDDSADGVTIKALDGGYARLPALFSITCELVVVQTPKRMRTEFSFDAFVKGDLMHGGKVGWI